VLGADPHIDHQPNMLEGHITITTFGPFTPFRGWLVRAISKGGRIAGMRGTLNASNVA
jgi:hypothetical protein